MFFLRRKFKRPKRDITLDEIFLDSKNIPGFQQETLEGRLEKPITNAAFIFLAVIFSIAVFLLAARIIDLQIFKGASLEIKSEDNRFRSSIIPSVRGIIYDRNKKELAFNIPGFRLILDRDDLDKLDEDAVSSLESNSKLTNLAVEEDLSSKLEFARIHKNDLVIAAASSWKAAEEFRRAYSKIPIRVEPFPLRQYVSMAGLAHVVGYIGSSDGQKFTGKNGVEKSYDSFLSGNDGTKLFEIDSKNQIISESVQENPKSGDNIMLTVDGRISDALYNIIQGVIKERGFSGGAAVLTDISTGEILALVSYPEYNPNVLVNGKDSGAEVRALLNDSGKPFFNRAIKGLYPPGSIIKPLLALAALNEKIIDPKKEILANGYISIPNPYDPAKKSFFYDWKIHGLVDMQKALAVSSNVYFYTIGGGYGDIKGLGINKLGDYARMFNFGEKSNIDLAGEEHGEIPSIELKKNLNSKDPEWRVGDTYNSSIGQGYWQVTPLQMAMFVASIADNGKKSIPHVVKSIINSADGNNFSPEMPNPKENVAIPEESFKTVKEGMRMAALVGTAKALGDLRVSVAGKTGTAEIGSGKYTNSWFMGFMPYENPRLALAVVLEHGRAENLIGAVYATRQLLEWMFINTPEYFK